MKVVTGITVISLFCWSCLAKVDLRQSTVNKEFISQLEDGKFEIVHPFQVRDKNERIGIDTRNYFLSPNIHYQHITLVIRSSSLINSRLKLILTLNEYLVYDKTKVNKLDHAGEHLYEDKIENCYYQGTVNGDETSFVALSTCNGLKGVIGFENGTAYGIWPLEGGDHGRRHPHVLYLTTWNDTLSCGSVADVNTHGFRRRRDSLRQTKHVELAVIADYKLMTDFKFVDFDVISYILEAVNIADYMVSRDLNIKLSVVYAEFWKDAQRVDLQNEIEQTLRGVHEYTTGHIYSIVKDATIMLTSSSFLGQDAVSAMSSSICTSRAVGLIKAGGIKTGYQTAQLIAHSTGHILGFDHDSPDCLCPYQKQCVMSRQQSNVGSSFIWQFSKCSIARMRNILQSGHVQCLLNKPFQELRLHQCGNGVVDGDEECDCGPRSECFDPCCDALTCTLRAHAQCASHQACCHRCELRKSGTLCRDSKSSCDVAEYCDGKSADCPVDGFLVDGIQCGINGNCWNGNCSDREQQCKTLWGEDAKAAEDPCYTYNEKGLEYGNCGKNRNNGFKKCEKKNIKCGSLYCKAGHSVPLNSTFTSFNFQFLSNDHHVQCKAITNSESARVVDGTNCGSGSICLRGDCLPLIQVSPPIHCPSNNLALQCSGHGDCTTTQKCICYDGWNGVACDIRVNGTRRDVVSTMSPVDFGIPGLNGRTIETTTLLIILLSVGVFLLISLVCMMFFYRRKSSGYSNPAVVDKLDESYCDDGSRAIKFGTMPSYRDEKRKHKKNKRVYDALHKINEVDERETASLKSKESSSIASGTAYAFEKFRDDMKRNIFNEFAENRIYAETSIGNNPLSHCGASSPAHSDFFAYSKRPHHGLKLSNACSTDSNVNDILTFDDNSFPTNHSIGNLTAPCFSSFRDKPSLNLSSLQQLMRNLPEEREDPSAMMPMFDHDNPEPMGDIPFRINSSNYNSEQVPESVDSGNPESAYESSRHSPTLFSDPFKLDIETHSP